MTPRERVRQAVNRKSPDRIPKEIGLTPGVMERFKQETGSTNPAEYFGIETRDVGFESLREEDMPDFSAYMKDMPPEARIMCEYGTASVPANFHHFWRCVWMTCVESHVNSCWKSIPDLPIR